MKVALRKKALKLRRKGLSYSEIKEEIPVSKSTLSLWLRGIKLTPKQSRRLKNKIKRNQPLGAKANRARREEKSERIIGDAKREISSVSKKDLFYMGLALYWAEGTKQRDHNPSQRVVFSNSDPEMIRVMMKWFTKVLGLAGGDLDFEIYSHSNIRDREREIVKYWSKVTKYPEASFGKIYYKKGKKRVYRRNKNRTYYGLLRIVVRRSTDLNRKIAGWISGVAKQCGMV